MKNLTNKRIEKLLLQYSDEGCQGGKAVKMLNGIENYLVDDRHKYQYELADFQGDKQYVDYYSVIKLFRNIVKSLDCKSDVLASLKDIEDIEDMENE